MIPIRDLNEGDEFSYSNEPWNVHKLLGKEVMPNVALVEFDNKTFEVNNNVLIIKKQNKMETTNQETQLLNLNEVDSNLVTIRNEVVNSLGSLFTKDDVLNVLARILITVPKESNSNFNLAEKFDALIQTVTDELEEMEGNVDSEISSDGIEIDTYEIEVSHCSGNRYEFEIENAEFSINFKRDVEKTIQNSVMLIQQELKSFKENNLK